MKKRRLSRLAMRAGFVFLSTSPVAAGQVGPGSDVVGINLAMSADDARRKVEADFPGVQVVELPVSVSTPNLTKKATAGFVADLASKADHAASEAAAAGEAGRAPMNRTVHGVGDASRDYLKVLYDPNDGATDIFAVSRFTEYGPGRQPVTQTMVDALKEKYGNPVVFNRNGSLIDMVWLQPGVLQRTRSSRSRCTDDSGFGFFYESADTIGRFGMPHEVRSAGEAFAQAINLVHGHNMFKDFSACGTVLRAKLTLTRGGDYVGSLSARLIDLTRAQAELGSFDAAFWREADEARQKRLGIDAGARPRL